MRYLRVLVLLAIPWLAHADPLPFSPEQVGDAKVIYVDFWASWCVPCRRSFPWLNQMQEKYGDQGFTVIGINVDQERADAERFLASYPALFPLVFDPHGELASRYQLEGMPSAVLLAANGSELSRHIGFVAKHSDKYEKEIVRLMESQQ
ncbi:MAG TPA: TlpA family protein disulfide reductase [Alcanivorax sp.]|jgi:thiol-disulfide isomerase/thioredoxin|uniref:Thioredoxin n=1 Tax=Alcanivorax jadensis T9 TaxID=1177181 RepID=A0ABR4W931_9GAMM|nr:MULTISPECIES: TlpA disulfide reductase family protein [Alcanivorax]KGD59921.1 thioredoxin [Alcanivorax jadensis T9]MAC13382.1 TlpA family protein disulfide reductase [Alcanivorax sp.]MBG32400.1 TlpA family protein disulfide reductase [Alcanivorax sp.]MBP20810.1 TlpA family protein disulfide reductase [Alcanivorax sp.]MDF1637060.1 TlpA disulfide reductase family protein [Alcanivorax jadensis]|tara:strand:+ start:725 stop:1171 length:447 start_codon:yes stop_codon:yes gene_type:complete